MEQIQPRHASSRSPQDCRTRQSERPQESVLVDGGGLLLAVMVTPADRPDRDIARDLLWRARLTHPELTLAWADSAYAGTLVNWARDSSASPSRSCPGRRADRLRRATQTVGGRMDTELIMRARRNCRDHERLVQHSEAHISWSAITLMTRRRTRPRPSPR
ncbi:transposase [Acrocarpospora macrocephala]|uniref:transposase n=1 Tax=Acrocarpospora macrocephala TaxID=150177 RepID=UPI0035A257F1